MCSTEGSQIDICLPLSSRALVDSSFHGRIKREQCCVGILK